MTFCHEVKYILEKLEVSPKDYSIFSKGSISILTFLSEFSIISKQLKPTSSQANMLLEHSNHQNIYNFDVKYLESLSRAFSIERRVTPLELKKK